MKKPAQSTESHSTGGNNVSTDSDSEKLRRELERVSKELAACKEQLREQGQSLTDSKSNFYKTQMGDRIREKEISLDRLANEMERAQELATMGSWLLEVESGEVTWSPGLHRIFGQDPSAPVPTLDEQASWYKEESWHRMMDAVTRTVHDGSPYNIELDAMRRDGSIRILRSIGEAERDENGRIIRLRGVAQDISDIKETEAKLKWALDQEKIARVYKDQFLANMSHEIRTPLNGVVGFANLLRDEDLDSGTKNEYLDIIENCSNQLLNLIGDILDIAKIESGEIEIEKRPINPAKITRDLAATFEEIKSERGKANLRLLASVPKDSENLEIHSDPFRIQQILTNLISNAIKFSDEGTIEFGYRSKDTAIEFFVKDEGIGIEPERLDLIFERFEHLDGTEKKYEGTGLGLAISQGLARLLGATLTVESEFGAGSIFRLEVPLKEGKSIKEREESVLKKEGNNQIRPGTVLVVEDNKANQMLLKALLKPAPCKILLAHNGEEAIQVYQKHPEIDLVLMDIRLPLMNGDIAAREILKIDPSAKIIAQTAYAMAEEREEFLKAGFIDYISKPYEAKKLLAMVSKCIGTTCCKSE